AASGEGDAGPCRARGGDLVGRAEPGLRAGAGSGGGQGIAGRGGRAGGMAGAADGADRRGLPGPAARGAADLDEGAPEVLFGEEPEDRQDRGLRDGGEYRDPGPWRDDPEGQPEGAGRPAV